MVCMLALYSHTETDSTGVEFLSLWRVTPLGLASKMFTTAPTLTGAHVQCAYMGMYK